MLHFKEHQQKPCYQQIPLLRRRILLAVDDAEQSIDLDSSEDDLAKSYVVDTYSSERASCIDDELSTLDTNGAENDTSSFGDIEIFDESDNIKIIQQ